MMELATFVSLGCGGGGGGFVSADSCAHATPHSNKVGDVVGPPAYRVRMAQLEWTRRELEEMNVEEMNERMDSRDVELKRVQGVRLVGALCC